MNKFLLLVISLIILPSASFAGPDDIYKAALLQRSNIPVDQLDSISPDQVKSDLKALQKTSYGQMVMSNLEFPGTVNLKALDSFVARSFQSFRKTFLKFKNTFSSTPLNEKRTRVYMLGGGMEYFYFRGAAVGIPDFMSKEQFRFLGLSRDSFLGGEVPADIKKYIQKQIADDLAQGYDIVLMDTVSKGISLGSTYGAVKELIAESKSASRVIAFGIPEYDLGHVHSGGYSGHFGASSTQAEFDEDVKEYGWAYYGFGEQSGIENLQQAARFSSGKFMTGTLEDGLPQVANDFGPELKEDLARHSIPELIKKELLSYEDTSYLINRLRSLEYYIRAKSNLNSKMPGTLSCKQLF